MPSCGNGSWESEITVGTCAELAHAEEGLECQLNSPGTLGLLAPVARGTFPEQGSKWRPLHCKVDSQPLDYLESPEIYSCAGISGQLSQSREKRT